MTFEEAVLATDIVADCLRLGLQALGSDSAKLVVAHTRDIDGSVDIDSCLQEQQPNAPRWDYVLGYRKHIFYVEVHPATTGHLDTMRRKLEWLRSWRRGTKLQALVNQSTEHWIVVGRTTISKGAVHTRRLTALGLGIPVRSLDLDKTIQTHSER